jgi:PhnB protein
MGQVKPIPDGYTTVTQFLNIKGAAEAIEFYKKALGAEERGRMAGPDGLVMHAELKIGNSFLIADAIQNSPTLSSTHLYVEDANAWWKRAIDAGMQIAMPIDDMFWGDRYGILVDKWGNRWGIATHIEDVPREDMAKRAADAMKKQ